MSSNRLLRQKSSSLRRIGIRCSFYHTFPDPSEKPIITTSVSGVKPQLDKSKIETTLDDKFKMKKPFPNFDSYNKSMSKVNTKTFSTTLKNGLIVASEDRYSLMASLAFVVKTGR
jgi:hypothetical protein